MDDFEIIWDKHSVKGVSPKLKPLVHDVLRELRRSDARLESLRTAMESLLVFLSSDGRLDENCRTVDAIFSLEDTLSWQHLPESYQGVFEDMGGALHDTISSPDIAENFDSTPEMLLERVREWSS